MTPGPRYCTHAREFHAIERRAERAELECQRLHEIIATLRDNEAYLQRRLDVMRDRERAMLATDECDPCPQSPSQS